jgi:hypothetical protein
MKMNPARMQPATQSLSCGTKAMDKEPIDEMLPKSSLNQAFFLLFNASANGSC